jgi:hypothetical protein
MSDQPAPISAADPSLGRRIIRGIAERVALVLAGLVLGGLLVELGLRLASPVPARRCAARNSAPLANPAARLSGA